MGLNSEWAPALNLLRNHQSNRDEDANEGGENSYQEERLNLLAFPQSNGSLAAFDNCELHDVKHCDEFHNGENRQKGAKRQSDPQDELVKDEAKRRMRDVKLGKIIFIGIRSKNQE